MEKAENHEQKLTNLLTRKPSRLARIQRSLPSPVSHERSFEGVLYNPPKSNQTKPISSLFLFLPPRSKGRKALGLGFTIRTRPTQSSHDLIQSSFRLNGHESRFEPLVPLLGREGSQSRSVGDGDLELSLWKRPRGSIRRRGKGRRKR